MIKFGPSGISTSYFEEVDKGTFGVAEWLKNKGLDCFEYSFGRGVSISSSKAIILGNEFKRCGIEMSVHAPYYINLAGYDEEKLNSTTKYFIDSLLALRDLGGNRCVFHPGSLLSSKRDEALSRAKSHFETVLKEIYNLKLNDMFICAETMGKIAQLGTVDEVIELCNMDSIVLPCIDFGHINAREQGSLKGFDDYCRVIERILEGIGEEKTKNMHVHFSKIMYTKGGEKCHLTFEDTEYGPEFEPLAQAFLHFNLQPYVVCESAGTQTEDAMYMKDYFNSISQH